MKCRQSYEKTLLTVLGNEYREQLDLYLGYNNEEHPLLELAIRFGEYHDTLKNRMRPQPPIDNPLSSDCAFDMDEDIPSVGSKISGGNKSASAGLE